MAATLEPDRAQVIVQFIYSSFSRDFQMEPESVAVTILNAEMIKFASLTATRRLGDGTLALSAFRQMPSHPGFRIGPVAIVAFSHRLASRRHGVPFQSMLN
jgi:hypothetical protein